MKQPLHPALLLAMASSLIPQRDAFPFFPQAVPNALNIDLDGVRVVGLGHESAAATSTQLDIANPFGVAAFPFQNNLANLWPTICPLDSDNDGLTNGEELCDPECLFNFADPNRVQNPACVNGAVLSHPGFAGDGNGVAPHIKAHGALMIMSWLFLAPAGITLALVLKKGSNPFWFKAHRALMLSAVVLTLVAFIVMVGVTGLNIKIQHPKIGITVVVFAILQPISGFLRPHNPPKGEAKTSARLWWEFQHQWFGRLIMLLAMSAIITGLPVAFGVEKTGAAQTFLAIVFVFAVIGSIAFVFLYRNKKYPPIVVQNVSIEHKKDVEFEMQGSSSVKENVLTSAMNIGSALTKNLSQRFGSSRVMQRQASGTSTKMGADEEDEIEVASPQSSGSPMPRTGASKKRDFNDFQV